MDGNLIVPVAPSVVVGANDAALHLDPGQKYETISHWYSKKDIFPHQPMVQDIKQGHIGDCAFLAALGCIVRRNPANIMNIMRDERGGHVVVRLYNLVGGAPVYYRIDKTSVVGTTGATYNLYNKHSAPWVGLLEKAVAIHVMGRQYTPINGGPAQISNTFTKALTGFSSMDTFKVLLNNTANEVGIRAMRANNADVDFLALMRLTRNNIQNGNTWNDFRILKKVFGRVRSAEAQDFLTVNTQLAANGIPPAMLYTNSLYRVNAENQHKIIRQPTITHYLNTNYGALQPNTRACIDHFVAGLSPGKRGTGIYNLEQLTVYRKIAVALQEGRGVVLSCARPLGLLDPTNGYAGENKARGLAAPHGYQVLDVKTENNLRYIGVRNPWGHYGRDYVANANGTFSAVGRDQQVGRNTSGAFWLELSDITKRFHRYVASQPL